MTDRLRGAVPTAAGALALVGLIASAATLALGPAVVPILLVPFVAVALLSSAAYIVSRIDPAWTLSAALFASLFNGNWGELGLPDLVAPDRLLLLAGVTAVLLRALERGGDPALTIRPVHWVLLAASLYTVGSAIAVQSLGEHSPQFRLVDRLGLAPFALFFVAPAAFSGPRQRAVLLGMLVVVGGYLGLTALFETIGLDALVWPKYILDSSYGIHFGRARGPFAEAAANGLVMFACGVASTIAVLTWRRPWARTAAASVALLCILGILLSLSRSAWVGSMVATVVTLLAFRELRRYLWLAAATAGLVVGMALIIVPGLSESAEARRDQEQTVWDRGNSNRAALLMVAERPLFGVGWGAFTRQSVDYYRQADDYPLGEVKASLIVHNVFISNAAELGLVGTTLWVLGLALAIGGSLVPRAPPELRPWRIMLLAYASAWLVVVNFSPLVNVLPNLMLWLFAGLLLAPAHPGRAAPAGATASSEAPAPARPRAHVA